LTGQQAFDSSGSVEPVDTTKASIARMYDYFLGGKDNYEVDRLAAEKTLELNPHARVAVRHNREFMRRAVAALSEAGCIQFLDIGTGIPTEPNLHKIVQERHPETRVVYVDNDPIVLAHAGALLHGTPDGLTAFIPADLNDPAAILAHPTLRESLDLDAPVALSLIAVLHFVRDDEQVHTIVNTLMDALAPGSFLALSHVTADFDPAVEQALAKYRESGVFVRNRTREQVLSLFEGFELLEPGVVATHNWRPPMVMPKHLDKQVAGWARVARKI
jgi:trans-aconitate methyltransferase